MNWQTSQATLLKCVTVQGISNVRFGEVHIRRMIIDESEHDYHPCVVLSCLFAYSLPKRVI